MAATFWLSPKPFKDFRVVVRVKERSGYIDRPSNFWV